MTQRMQHGYPLNGAGPSCRTEVLERSSAAPLRGTAGAPATGLRVEDARHGRAARARGSADRSRSFRREVRCCETPSSSAIHCPARCYRVNGGPTGRRMRSATPTIDPAPTRQGFGACGEDGAEQEVRVAITSYLRFEMTHRMFRRRLVPVIRCQHACSIKPLSFCQCAG
jgi:hypothetical protein